jgi:hypothetical protein
LAYFKNFTADVLYDLSLEGLVSSPTYTFLREMSKRKRTTTKISNLGTTTDSIEAHYLLCFPWAIVEGEKEKVDASQKEYGRCQAAYAASISLSIMEELAKYADVQYEGQHIPPVFAFTFVEPNVKLWIAYSAGNIVGNRDHVCIASLLVKPYI